MEGISRPDIQGRFAINLIENGNNELLLLKRHRETDIGPGLWGFSAGHIEPGESPEQCSEREIREELGSNINLELINQFGPVLDRFFGGKYELYLYHYDYTGGSITLNHEHTEFCWVSKEQYRNFDVVDGIDDDIYYLKIWPSKYLNEDKLPPVTL
jgi:8-oxo-dGTP pyrophosphatase MutT (NUDIX family)